MRLLRSVLAISSLLGLVLVVPAAAQEGEPRKITVTAKKYEFSPSRIELTVGETVEITFESEDTKHGFVCKELGIEKVIFKKGEPATITVKAEKPGTYAFKCAKFCGFGHGKMKGEIVVSAEP
jgi:cytochrome c oxidase subunit 2